MKNNNSLSVQEPSAQLPTMNTSAAISNVRNAALKSIAYSARVTRNNPSAIVLLIDQSESMLYDISEEVSRSQAVADIVNNMIENLIMKCQRDSIIREYFDVLVIGYGREIGENSVRYGWEGNLEGRSWVNISDLKENVYTTETLESVKMMPWGPVKSLQTKKVWINPYAGGLTPMRAAMELCRDQIQEWVEDHPESFPPMVFNITDGFPTDIKTFDEIKNVCEEIKQTGTSDGKTLLFNCLLTDEGQENVLPKDGSTLGFEHNEYLMAMYEGSSFLPHELKGYARQIFQDERFMLGESKGIIINSTISSLIGLLNIGTSYTLANASD